MLCKGKFRGESTIAPLDHPVTTIASKTAGTHHPVSKYTKQNPSYHCLYFSILKQIYIRYAKC